MIVKEWRIGRWLRDISHRSCHLYHLWCRWSHVYHTIIGMLLCCALPCCPLPCLPGFCALLLVLILSNQTTLFMTWVTKFQNTQNRIIHIIVIIIIRWGYSSSQPATAAPSAFASPTRVALLASLRGPWVVLTWHTRVVMACTLLLRCGWKKSAVGWLPVWSCWYILCYQRTWVMSLVYDMSHVSYLWHESHHVIGFTIWAVGVVYFLFKIFFNVR